MKSTVSIIIPVYNVEKYIDRCIKSVINQTYEKLEIILIDDGSPDNCPEICDKWSQTDSRIKVIHKKNGGLSDARNAGLSIATGKYVLFVDSDDWISNNMVENMVQAMENNDVDIVICQYIVAYENGEEKNLKTEVGERIFDSKEALRLLLQNTIITNHVWRKLYKRNLIKPNIFPVNRNYEDIYTVADFFISCNKIMYLDDAYYYYFQNDVF